MVGLCWSGSWGHLWRGWGYMKPKPFLLFKCFLEWKGARFLFEGFRFLFR